MEAEGVKVTVAFLAGLASFASPCVLPLVPAYLGMLTGLSLEGWASRRGHLLAHAVVFVLGFSLLFVLTGAAATALGRALSRQLPLLQRLGGIALVVLGLHLTGVIRLPFLMRERSLRGAANPGMGYAASFLTGMFLFTGWVPCVGPVLMAIYMLAGDETCQVWPGVYTAGLGVLLVGGPRWYMILSTPSRPLTGSRWAAACWWWQSAVFYADGPGTLLQLPWLG